MVDPFADGKWVSWSSIGESVPVSNIFQEWKNTMRKSILEWTKWFFYPINRAKDNSISTYKNGKTQRNNEYYFLFLNKCWENYVLVSRRVTNYWLGSYVINILPFYREKENKERNRLAEVLKNLSIVQI